MLFFDFLYYQIYKFYSGYNKKGAESTSAGIIGGFQALNVLTVIMLVHYMDKEKTSINKPVVIFVFIVFQIYTYIRYVYQDKHSVDEIKSKWLSKTESSRKQTVFFLFLYGAISIIGCFGLALYLSMKK
jgi:hypothetical protein